MKVVTRDFLNDNEFRKYPFDERATFDEGDLDLNEMDPRPLNSLLTDMRLMLPKSLAASAFVSGISSSKSLVTVTIMGNPIVQNTFYDPYGPVDVDLASLPTSLNEQYSMLGSMVLARVQVKRSAALPGQVVPLIPVEPGVGGWVVFGSGILNDGIWSFSGPKASSLSFQCVTRYDYGGVKSLGRKGFDTSVSGKVTLAGQGGVEVVEDDLGLAIRFAGSNLQVRQGLDSFKGDCGGRPESDTCLFPPIRSINGIVPQGPSRELVIVLDKPMYATIEGSGDDEIVVVSSDTPQELFCTGRLDIPDGCSAGQSPYTGFLRSAYSPPSTGMSLAPDLSLTFELSGTVQASGTFAYLQQHPTRPSVAVFSLQDGPLSVLGESVTHLHVDSALWEWQLYGPQGPSMNAFGSLMNNMRGSRSITYMGQPHSMTLGITSMFDKAGVDSIQVAIDAPDAFEEAGTYVKVSYCRYAHSANPGYFLELRGAPDDTWVLLKGTQVLAAGTMASSLQGTQVQGYIRQNGESAMRTIAVTGAANG